MSVQHPSWFFFVPLGRFGAGAVLLAMLFGAAPGWAVTRALVPADVLADYRQFLHGRPPLSLRDFAGPGSRRDVAELVLLQQALARGGWGEPVEFVVSDSYARTLVELGAGRAQLSGTTAWRRDIMAQTGLSASEATLRDGEFEGGLFTLADHPLQSTPLPITAAELGRLSVVSNRAWTADWDALSRLKLARLDSVPRWETMLDLLRAHRVDAVLAPFPPGRTMRFEAGGLSLQALEGVKLVLRGSRHFAVSRTGENSEALYLALNRGLIQLQREGVVGRAYRQSGFINPAVKAWVPLP